MERRAALMNPLGGLLRRRTETIDINGESMNTAAKIMPTKLSRRSILRNSVFTAGGVAMLGTVMAGGAALLGTMVSGSREAVALTKMTPTAVGYQATPQGPQRCDNCTQFESPAACKVVSGNIAAAGWCKIYAKKPA
jgi:hypothetical protein